MQLVGRINFPVYVFMPFLDVTESFNKTVKEILLFRFKFWTCQTSPGVWFLILYVISLVFLFGVVWDNFLEKLEYFGIQSNAFKSVEIWHNILSPIKFLSFNYRRGGSWSCSGCSLSPVAKQRTSQEVHSDHETNFVFKLWST